MFTGAKAALKPVDQLVEEGYATQSKRDAWYQVIHGLFTSRDCSINRIEEYRI